MTTVVSPRDQSSYLLLSCKLADPEKEIWEALFRQDKVVLSAKIYSMVARELPALTESAGRRQPEGEEKTYFRKLYLLRLPEYEHVIRFIQSNIRRPAFKEHLKRLILYGDGNPERSTIPPAPNPVPEAVPVSEAAQHAETRAESATRNVAKRSPRELFSEPDKLLQVIFLDLEKPEAAREFIWDEIPPEDYPEAMKAMKPFVKLVRFWNATKNIV